MGRTPVSLYSGMPRKGLERSCRRMPAMAMAPEGEPIPHPPGHLLIGNLFDLDTSHPLESLSGLAREYGPIFQLQLPGSGPRVIVSGHALVDELCDESRFDKMLGPGLK